jgi:hypothetical protein
VAALPEMVGAKVRGRLLSGYGGEINVWVGVWVGDMMGSGDSSRPLLKVCDQAIYLRGVTRRCWMRRRRIALARRHDLRGKGGERR